VANFVVATNEFRGSGAGERTEYQNVVAWDPLAEICGQFLSKGRARPVFTRPKPDGAGRPAIGL
jgi:Single-strand binding protein family.